MRRLLLLISMLAATCGPAACGGTTKPFAFPDVSSTTPGAEPTMTSVTGPPPASMLKVLTEGTGRPVADHDVLVANMKSQVWTDNGTQIKPYIDTFSTGRVLIRSVDEIVPGLQKKLPGVKVGSRILLVVPPDDGFGKAGNPQVDIGPKDSLEFVIDILDAFPIDAMATGTPARTAPAVGLPTVTDGADPKITVPSGPAPTMLVTSELLTGTGPKIAQGQQIVAQYTGVVWSTGTVFDTSWKPDRGPFAARIAETDQRTGEPGVIPGWVRALVGRRVGSRVLMVIPPKLGYGKTGNQSAGIKGTDTLVFVVDVLGVYNKPAAP